MNGQALAARLLQKRPSLRVVLMSGYGAALGPISRESPYHFIAKPFGLDALSALVSRVLGES
jgi:DNA-binding NtrC family response regulator